MFERNKKIFTSARKIEIITEISFNPLCLLVNPLLQTE